MAEFSRKSLIICFLFLLCFAFYQKAYATKAHPDSVAIGITSNFTFTFMERSFLLFGFSYPLYDVDGKKVLTWGYNDSGMVWAKNCSPWEAAWKAQLPSGSSTPEGAEQGQCSGWQLSTVTTHSRPARARMRRLAS